MSEALYSAMAVAFAAIEGAQKDATNPHLKNRYADLSSVVAAIKPHLCAAGLWFRQATAENPDGVCVETFVCHKSGAELSFGTLFIPASKKDAQGFGSALTYARRYSLMTAFGVCPEDDDGNAASRPKEAAKPANDELTSMEVLEMEDAINAAETMTQLQDVYTAAFRRVKGTPFEAALVKTKDARKTAIAEMDKISA